MIPADAVSTPYTYNECDISVRAPNRNFCATMHSVEVDSAAVVPPFTYNNQCASVLLTSYIPVLIIGYSIQMVLCFLLPLLVIQIGKRINLEGIIHHKAMAGILWPEYWLQSDDTGLVYRNKSQVTTDPTIVFNPNSIICFVILNNLMIMLSFGLCSPILAVAVTCSLLCQMNLWTLLLGRFACLMRNDTVADVDTNIHFALAALARVQFPVREVFKRSFWIIGWCSGFFCAMVCWDIAADEVGSAESIWIPTTTLCYLILLGIVSFCVQYYKGKQPGDDWVVAKRETEMAPLSFATTTTFVTTLDVENPIHSFKHDVK